jgi:hypothetical protein
VQIVRPPNVSLGGLGGGVKVGAED